MRRHITRVSVSAFGEKNEDIGGDDTVGSYSFRPIDLYRNDNATGFYRVFFGSNGTKFSISGSWVY